MNKFYIFPCMSKEIKGTSKKVTVLPLSTEIEGGLMLMFPISEQNANIVNLLMDEENRKKINQNTDVIGPYKTMLSSWVGANLFFSGIILDSTFDQELQDETMTAKAILIDSDSGILSCAIEIPFISAIILCILEDRQVYVSEKLYDVLSPQIEDARKGKLNELYDEDDEDDDEDDDDLPPKAPLNKGPNKKDDLDFPIDPNINNIVKDIFETKRPLSDF